MPSLSRLPFSPKSPWRPTDMRLLSFAFSVIAALPLSAADPAPRALTLKEAISLSASVAPVELARLDAAIASDAGFEAGTGFSKLLFSEAAFLLC